MAQEHKQSRSLFNRMADGYLLCLTSVYLLYPGTGGYQQITGEKARLFFLLSGLYLAASVLLRLELPLVGGGKWPSLRSIRRRQALPQILMAVYWLFTALSTLCSPFREAAFWGSARYDGFITISLYCGCFLLLCTYARPAKWLLWVFGGAVSVNCVIALVQLAGYNPLGLYPPGMTYYDGGTLYSGAFLGAVGNADLLSALLCVAIPAFWISLLVLRGRLRFLLLIPLGLSLAVLLKAYVEGGILGVFAGALLTLPVLARRGRRVVATAAAAGVLAVCITLVFLLGHRMGGFLYEASQILHGNWDDSFGSGRIYIWRSALELVGERPLLGGGPDTLGLRTDAAFERYDQALGLLIRSHVDTAHNEYLNILVNQGAAALLAYLAALALTALRWVKAAPDNPAAAICGGAVLGYCIQAFFGISSPITAPYFWIALACLISSLNPRQAVA